MKKISIAQSRIDYYETDDFKSNYADCLLQDYTRAVDRMQEIAEEQGFGYMERHIAESIVDFLKDELHSGNTERSAARYMTEFSSYWVGDYCLDSVMFGEQEEQLTGITDKNGKELTPNQLRRSFENAGYTVNGDYAYYVVSGGLKITIREGMIDKILGEIEERSK